MHTGSCVLGICKHNNKTRNSFKSTKCSFTKAVCSSDRESVKACNLESCNQKVFLSLSSSVVVEWVCVQTARTRRVNAQMTYLMCLVKGAMESSASLILESSPLVSSYSVP